MNNLRKSVFVAMALCFLSESAFAEGLKVENAWVRMPPPVSDTAAVYLELNNPTKQKISVASVSSSVSEEAEFHSMMMHGDMMHMMKMEKVEIEHDGSLVFEPNGNHLMLIGLKAPLKAGEHVMVVITEEDGTKHDVHAEVKDMRQNADSGHDHGHHGHH